MIIDISEDRRYHSHTDDKLDGNMHNAKLCVERKTMFGV